MKDVSLKTISRREAIASVKIVMPSELVSKIEKNQIPKGNPLEISKAVAFNAAKMTSTLLPFCHPIPIESMDVQYNLQSTYIEATVSIVSIYRTGVEMEALTACSAIALNIYDMLKPFGEEILIQDLQLISKKGGKSDLSFEIDRDLKAAVLVISDSVSSGLSEDKTGKLILDCLEQYKLKGIEYMVIADSFDQIQNSINDLANRDYELIISTGGTGISLNDSTPEAIKSLLDKEIPGIGEYLRLNGQAQNPFAILSRAISGIKGNTLILSLPGSKAAVKESLGWLFPNVFHVLEQIRLKSTRTLINHQ